jgi:hypothetical protein
LTINPETGLPEANFLKSLLPIALGAFLGPAGAAIGGGFFSSALAAGAAVGGITTLATGSLSKGLMAGLGAYGGFGLGEALAGAGANALTTAGVANYADTLAAQGLEAGTGAYGEAASKLALESQKEAFAKPFMDRAAAGLSAVTSSPEALGSFAKDNFKYLGAAASPIMADAMVPTATKVEPVDTGNIRKFSFDPYGQRYTPIGVFPAKDYKGGMAEGGIVALAGGGGLTAQQFKEQMYAGGLDDTAATKRGLELAAAQGLNAQQTTNLWNEALGTKFTPDDYARVSRQYGIAGPQANVDFVKGLATNDITAPDFLQQTTARGLTSQDVNAALQGSGLSKGAQFALTNQNIGSDANASETYGGLKGLSNNINYWLKQHPGASLNDIKTEMAKWDLTDEDFQRATGKAVGDYATGDIKKVENLAVGAGGNNAAVVNPNGTVTQTALGNVAINPVTGERAPTTTMQNIKDLYTAGGGSLGYTPVAPKTMAEFNQRFNTMNPEGDSAAAYNYLMGQGAYPTKSKVGEIMKPYSEAVLGVPADMSTKKYIYDATTRKMVLNPEYVPMSFDTKGVQSYGLSLSDISKYLKANNTATDAQVYDWAAANNVTPDQIAAALGPTADLAAIRAKYAAAKKAADKKAADKKAANTTSADFDPVYNAKSGGLMPHYADGGITGNGQLNLNIPLNLGGGNGAIVLWVAARVSALCPLSLPLNWALVCQTMWHSLACLTSVHRCKGLMPRYNSCLLSWRTTTTVNLSPDVHLQPTKWRKWTSCAVQLQAIKVIRTYSLKCSVWTASTSNKLWAISRLVCNSAICNRPLMFRLLLQAATPWAVLVLWAVILTVAVCSKAPVTVCLTPSQQRLVVNSNPHALPMVSL